MSALIPKADIGLGNFNVCSCQKETHALQQKLAYSITLSARRRS